MIVKRYIKLLVLVVGLVLFVFACKQGGVDAFSGSDSEWLIPQDEVRDGGPGKDGIPALFNPPFIPVQNVNFLQPADLVVGVRIGDQIWAFPHRILDRHEIVNIIRGALDSYVLSYCPLTGSALVWDIFADAGDKTFGVSGLLFNSNLILYDRDTDSLWAQMMLVCVNGSKIRTKPTFIHSIETTWATWQQLFPNSQVLSTDTGFNNASYQVYPYGDYKTSSGLLFSVNNVDNRLHAKERVHGVIISSDITRAYVIQGFSNEIQVTNDTISGSEIVVVGSSQMDIAVSFERKLADGTLLNFLPLQNELPVVMVDGEGTRWDIFGRAVSGPRAGSQLTPTLSYNAYWFAWAAFYPGAEIQE